MDRRTFCLLAGAGSTVLLGPPRLVPTRPRATGRLRFELDDARRWSLWYLGEGPPVPLIRSAALGAWITDQFLTLGDLEYSTVGIRRPPGGDVLVVRGRAGGVFLEAELMAGPPAAEPVATVTLTVYPDRDLPSIKGVRFFQAPADSVIAGSGEFLALVNGSDSNAGARLVTLPPAGESAAITSYAVLGLTRGTRGLALAFEPDDPGEGKVKLSTEGFDALSEWIPPRPVRPDGDTSRMRLCYKPDGDGVEALHALFVPVSLVDRELLASIPAPAGWVSGREHAGLTEAEMVNHAELCAREFDRRSLRFIELGDGYQRSAGDWETNARFPSGHRWLTDQIHRRQFRAGLWLAPFAVSEASGIPAAHPDWLVRSAENDVPAVLDTRPDWGGCVYALDGAHPGTRQWLFNLARRVVQEWGYDYITLDRLRWADAPGSHHGGLTPGDACKLGLGALRDGAGSDAFLRGCDAPLQHAIGFVNGMRIGPDAGPGWSGIQAPARAAGRRSFYHRGVWLNDPDTLSVAPPLSFTEAQLWTSIVAVSGGITVLSDDLSKLEPERVALLARALPVAAPGGRPIGAARAGPDAADRPADIWIAEGAPRWWTVVLANWGDEAMQQSVPLAALGLTGRVSTRTTSGAAAPLARSHGCTHRAARSA